MPASVAPRLVPLMVLLAGVLAACEQPREPTEDVPPDAGMETAEEPLAPEPTVEATTRALERGPARLSPSAAIANIDGWIERIEGEEIPHRDEILESLRDLRGELRRSPLDSDRIADIMDGLGNWTAAVGAARDDPAVERLGEVINQQAIRIRAGYTGPADLPAVPMRPGDPGPPERPLPEEGTESPWE